MKVACSSVTLVHTPTHTRSNNREHSEHLTSYYFLFISSFPGVLYALALAKYTLRGPSLSVFHVFHPSSTAVALVHIVATMTLNHVLAFHTIVKFIVRLVALLTSSALTWLKEHHWNFSVLRRVHLSNLVCFSRLLNYSQHVRWGFIFYHLQQESSFSDKFC
jgi:hypothetical protein